MPKIIEIVGVENKGSYALVHALTNEGDTVEIFVGGVIDIFYHHGVIKAHVKRNKTTKAIDNAE